ncbi:1,4-dihydroxy-6-naphthoate synthase [Gottfriedia solisilvae]|uniref:Uncharacterized protein n=1 Tax=Gottfriedia solisilvae TaxID=1516104 RepID=A0A8J3ASG9_9BACI|nr:1,4-dihydroxy-6-naphthoate synthase [Gottfriedia solisilvae]GGI17865.1 hypothetical protein GCM10007380_40070 [Gottfriedia solisilvae]
MEDLYCKIFINTNLSIDILTENISNFLSLEYDKYFSIKGDLFTIDVRKNKEFEEENSKTLIDGFLYYRYFLDMDLSDYYRKEEYKLIVGKLMEFLWGEGYLVVASCDFENELPNRGGYNKNIN